MVTFSQFLRNELGCHCPGIISTNTICNRHKALCAFTFMYAHRQNVLIQNYSVLILGFLHTFLGCRIDFHRFTSGTFQLRWQSIHLDLINFQGGIPKDLVVEKIACQRVDQEVFDNITDATATV